MHARRARTTVSLLCAGMLLVALSACATTADTGSVARPASPTPTAACPEIPGVELPPECAPYDPEASMAQNDVYRERFELADVDPERAEAILAAATGTLSALQAGGEITADTVDAALEEAGATSAQLRGDDGAFLFGAAVPGGCVYGQIDETAVSAELGGFIRDGGCLPAQ